MVRVLVVGGAGYIGSHTAKHLARKGHDVTTFDNLSTGHRELVKYGAFFEGTLLSESDLDTAFRAARPEAVLHFAAKSLVAESVRDPGLYYRSNVTGSLQLLEALKRHTPEAVFVFSSTCSLYGVTDEPISEIQPLAPTNPYARTKRVVEEMLADFDATFGLRHASLRYFNAAGCDPEGELGELHDPETHLIPRLLLHARDPSAHPVQIFGKDYPTPDGTCIRDYVHVTDLADAHGRAMDHLLKGGRSDVFNLGTTKGHSVLEVIHMVEKVTGKKLKIPVADRREGDPPFLVAGSKKATAILGWKPAHDLESIVRTAWAWVSGRSG